MKRIFTIFLLIFIALQVRSQCNIAGFDVCTGASPVTSFTNATLVSGSPLAYGAKYKFNNITSGVGALDAIISVDLGVNATLLSFDDDAAADETGVAGTQAALFSPKIATNTDLKGSAQQGVVQFTVTFYLHYNGNTLPPITSLPVAVAGLNFLHFDMDGYKIGTNGYFKEIGYVLKPLNGLTAILNFGASSTELVSGGTVTDPIGDWLLTYGSSTERNGISRCAEVVEKTTYALPQSSITFRMGYDYKPTAPYSGQNQGKPQRQYGSRFGCFYLQSAAPLPVSLSDFSVTYNNGVSTLNWTSAQETNLSKYEVLKSIDGIHFETAGSVKARNSSTAQKYSFVDINIPAGVTVVYYKLKMLDTDASFKFSEIAIVKLAAHATFKQLSIFPNPATDHVQIRFNADKTAASELRVINQLGQVVLSQKVNIQAGSNNIIINNLVKLKEGIYLTTMMVDDVRYSSNLVIWK